MHRQCCLPWTLSSTALPQAVCHEAEEPLQVPGVSSAKPREQGPWPAQPLYSKPSTPSPPPGATNTRPVPVRTQHLSPLKRLWLPHP